MKKSMKVHLLIYKLALVDVLVLLLGALMLLVSGGMLEIRTDISAYILLVAGFINLNVTVALIMRVTKDRKPPKLCTCDSKTAPADMGKDEKFEEIRASEL